MDHNLFQNFVNEALAAQSFLQVGSLYKFNPQKFWITTSHPVIVREFYEKDGEQWVEVGITKSDKPPFSITDVNQVFGMPVSFLETVLIPVQV